MRKGILQFLFTVLLSLIVATSLFSQNKNYREYGGSDDRAYVKGIIQDQSGNPVLFASLVLYNSNDSAQADGSATDENGEFAIFALPGNYFLKVAYLTLKEKIIPNIQMTREPMDLGVLILEQGTFSLDEVDMVAEKSTMELKLDKRVFNVGKDLGNKGNSAAEILDNVPSVTVDVEGNVSLRGSGNVRILVDGKPSGLLGVNEADALQQLQGNMIEKIEVITNPSARYDAEGEAGIINIVLKKEKNKGLNGVFTGSAGYPDDHALSYSLNLRRINYNLFSSYSLNYRNSPGSSLSWQEFKGDSLYFTERIREHSRGGISHNFRMGSDFYLNQFNTITLSGLYTLSDGDNRAKLTYRDLDSNQFLTQTVIRDEVEKENQENKELYLRYQGNFKEIGRKLTADFKYIESDDTEESSITETTEPIEAPIYQRTDNTEDQRQIIMQSDYVHAFSKDGKIEGGVKSSFRFIENKYLVEEQDEDGYWFSHAEYNNHFVFNENIFSAYLMNGNKIGNFSYQAGVRAEYSDVITELKSTLEKNQRNHMDIFPTMHLSYRLDSMNTIQTSYSRRVHRPGFRHLLPFYGFSDNRNFYSGNPDLKPEYTDSYEFGYLKNFDQGSLLTSLYYRHNKGVIERITIADSIGYLRRFPINLSEKNVYGFEFNFDCDLTAWWTVSGNFNYFRVIRKGEYEDQIFDSDNYSWTTRMVSKLKLPDLFDFQISGNYRAPSESTQGRSNAMYSADIGLSKDMIKGKATLTISVKDVLNTRAHSYIIELEDYYSETEFQWRARQILLNFNYRLNQSKKRSRTERSGSDGGGDDF